MISTLQAALTKRDYTSLTPVQTAVTAPELTDQDLLVSAQTGSGKTVGFGLAIGGTILDESGQFGPASAPLALIIAPTRELAMQVKRELAWLYAEAGVVMASCVGGMDMRSERRTLDRGAHIVVATPGRVRDHITRGALDMSALRAVVLDEADEMLDLGFREDLEFILSEAPESRRTLLFSATVPPQIERLARSYQKPDAKRIATISETRQHADIEYRALTVVPQDVENAIINVLRYYEAKTALVFCNTRAAVARLTARFTNRGFQVVALSGELSQTERSHALQAMRDGRARVCVATDVAARGIDLPGLELVVHADLPTNAETLLHRSGRTGRAGRKGVSALIVPIRQRSKAERLLRFAKLTAEWDAPPSADAVRARDDERLIDDPIWKEVSDEADRALMDRLTQSNTAEQLAQAFIRLYRARASAPEELSGPSDRTTKSPKAAFGPSAWFSVSVGRSQRAEPRWLLPMLCKAGGLTKDDIGAIRIQESETFVEVKADKAPSLTGASLDDGATITALEGTPDIKPIPPSTARPPKNRPLRDKGHASDRKGDKRGAKPGGGKKPGPKTWTDTPPPKAHHASDDWPDQLPPARREGAKVDAMAKPAKARHDPDTVAPYKPAGKPNPKKKPRGDTAPFAERKPKFDKPVGKSSPKGQRSGPNGKGPGRPDRPQQNAADPSARFVPPGAKPRVGRGGNAKPRRPSPKPKSR